MSIISIFARWKQEDHGPASKRKKKRKSGLILAFSPLNLVSQHRCVLHQAAKTHLSDISTTLDKDCVALSLRWGAAELGRGQTDWISRPVLGPLTRAWGGVRTAYDGAAALWVLRYSCQGNSSFWLRARGSWEESHGGGRHKSTGEKEENEAELGRVFVQGCHLRADNNVRQRNSAQENMPWGGGSEWVQGPRQRLLCGSHDETCQHQLSIYSMPPWCLAEIQETHKSNCYPQCIKRKQYKKAVQKIQ